MKTTGALPPKDMAWQEGKTAASICFVKTSEKMISHLRDKIAQVKSGNEIITEFLCMGVSRR